MLFLKKTFIHETGDITSKMKYDMSNSFAGEVGISMIDATKRDRSRFARRTLLESLPGEMQVSINLQHSIVSHYLTHSQTETQKPFGSTEKQWTSKLTCGENSKAPMKTFILSSRRQSVVIKDKAGRLVSEDGALFQMVHDGKRQYSKGVGAPGDDLHMYKVVSLDSD